MKIEFGFQPNCSELVAYASILEPSDVVDTMLRIMELTGWSWWAQLLFKDMDNPGYDNAVRCLVRVPPDEIEERLILGGIAGWEHGIAFNPVGLLDRWKDELPSVFHEKNLGHSGYDVGDEPNREELIQYLLPWPILAHVQHSNPIILEEDLPDDAFNEFYYQTLDDFYSEFGKPKNAEEKIPPDAGLTLQISDNDIDSMPEFHTVRIAMGAKYSGNLRWYTDWMVYHFLDRDEYIAHLEKKYEGHVERSDSEIEGFDTAEEWIRNHLIPFDSHPPLSKSGELSYKDKKEIRRIVYSEYSRLGRHYKIQHEITNPQEYPDRMERTFEISIKFNDLPSAMNKLAAVTGMTWYTYVGELSNRCQMRIDQAAISELLVWEQVLYEKGTDPERDAGLEDLDRFFEDLKKRFPKADISDEGEGPFVITFGIDTLKLLEMQKEQIELPVYEILLKQISANPDILHRCPVMMNVPSESVIIDRKQEKHILFAWATPSTGNWIPLTIKIDHEKTNRFSLLHWIRKNLDCDFDLAEEWMGDRVNEYRYWMAYHFDRERFSTFRKDETNWDGVGDWDVFMHSIEEEQPLPGSGELNEEDQYEIEAHIYDIN